VKHNVFERLKRDVNHHQFELFVLNSPRVWLGFLLLASMLGCSHEHAYEPVEFDGSAETSDVETVYEVGKAVFPRIDYGEAGEYYEQGHIGRGGEPRVGAYSGGGVDPGAWPDAMDSLSELESGGLYASVSGTQVEFQWEEEETQAGKDGCPTETAKVLPGLCVDKHPHPPLHYLAAADACFMRRGHVCSYSEFYAACTRDVAGISSGASVHGLWIGNWTGKSTVMHGNSLLDNGCFSFADTVSIGAEKEYRCCFSDFTAGQ